ncbi:uncharacterized protein DUF1657 [Natranaerovirga hydrolytica]|uniref:Uncharacterized protein DUF1657 n=1 Tax=Natranaerovirga hydrolytica TaxID=680378 RepID=A0A4R1MKU3_9FIRM|nr:DUF1657 domain-containing protein [Natranaerovirga hydrolytica]TCK93187.1 uncharacterized protein DUF1657 [Natranaerovirga hydrolytica]
MTVKSDLEKVLAYCEVVKGNYAIMAESTEDQQAKDTFNHMKSDINTHMDFLNNRLQYITQNNELNKDN